MALPYTLFQTLQTESLNEAWKMIFQYAWELCSAAFGSGKPAAQVTQRDRSLADIDLFLATAGWDLWRAYEDAVPHTADVLTQWWQSRSDGKAVLILDSLSLREIPWLLSGVQQHGLTLHNAQVFGAELPADTTSFAKALGFSQRSDLSGGNAGSAHRLHGARTESADMAWKDCADSIGAEPDWVFWHHWPDHRLHDHNEAGKGLTTLTAEVHKHLSSADFWHFIERLATGRRLVITSDHGYAASGLFPDSDKQQTAYLKKLFKSRRWVESRNDAGPWVPPIDLSLETRHGQHLFVLGRRKWKNAGGYPTLTHGGLSALEVAVPWIELTN